MMMGWSSQGFLNPVAASALANNSAAVTQAVAMLVILSERDSVPAIGRVVPP